MLSLIFGKYKPNKLWNKKGFRLKFVLRTLIFPLCTFNYLNQLLKLPNIKQILSTQGLLPIKLHRPYLCTNFNVIQRAQVIIDHYNLVNQLENYNLRNCLQTSNRNLLASLNGKKEESFLFYCCPGRFDREGEVTIELHFESLLITSLSFSFSMLNEKEDRILLIGGLQGPNKNISNNVIHDATKAAHGLFPKRLVMEAVFLLAKLCKINKIIAVSDTTHIFRSLRYQYSKKDQFFASYNKFWFSLGGLMRKDNLFALPLCIERKNLQSIVSKKRSEYRRRYKLLDSLNDQVCIILNDK
ncbi:VirK/YbjX family protein [Pantoea sp. Mhis]|uniref:VirK/YbjX family protein n=1 Tax=Pantoea sp. Mhis TaxID=2576759 RepID=UPI001F29F68D|nr:VirK/YbjX family protein [Pantoea sp. Mhis]